MFKRNAENNKTVLEYEKDVNSQYDVSDQLAEMIGAEIKRHEDKIKRIEIVITSED